MYKVQAEWPLAKFAGENIIWAEDLFDIRIVPYPGELKKAPDYQKFRERLEPYCLVVVKHFAQEVVVVECKADVEGNTLYIAKDIFEKHWKHIKRSMDGAMAANHLLVNPNKCVDKYLLKDKKPVAPQSVDVWERRKQSLFDNPKNLFFYSCASEILHDKDCQELKKVDPKDLSAGEVGPEGYAYCPRCAYRLYSRVSCSPVSKDVDAVEHLVRKHHIGREQWIEYVEEDGVKLNMVSLSVYRIKCHEDTWEIRIDEDRMINLWHNNYVRTDDKERYITDGFHDQKIKSRNLKTILDMIVRYDWRTYHKEVEAEEKQEAFSRLEETRENTTEDIDCEAERAAAMDEKYGKYIETEKHGE